MTKKKLTEMTQEDANIIFTLCTGNKWARENVPNLVTPCAMKFTSGEVELYGKGEYLQIDNEGITARHNDGYHSGESPVNYAGILYLIENYELEVNYAKEKTRN